MTIPEDIMKAARQAAADLYIEYGFPPDCGRIESFLSGERDDDHEATADDVLDQLPDIIRSLISKEGV